MKENKYREYAIQHPAPAGYLTEVCGLEGIRARVVAASISKAGRKLTTLELQYPRIIHSEIMTHRVLSRNSSSSRAIPIEKMINRVETEPAMPIHWGLNQPGMQAQEQQADEVWARDWWLDVRDRAVWCAKKGAEGGLHKQIVNRIIEPWQYMATLISSTEFDNLFNLRIAPDAQPEFQMLAVCIQQAMRHAEYSQVAWHLPYISEAQKQSLPHSVLVNLSIARCCRVSYLGHGESKFSIEEDIKLAKSLLVNRHLSPLEHVAVALRDPNLLSGNFVGWHQQRQIAMGVDPLRVKSVPWLSHVEALESGCKV